MEDIRQILQDAFFFPFDLMDTRKAAKAEIVGKMFLSAQGPLVWMARGKIEIFFKA